MDALSVRPCSPQEPSVRAVIDAHFALMRAQTPLESAHVLPAEGLIGTFMVAAEQDGAVLGIGALARVDERHSEIKSMHTRAEARGRGIARAILDALLAEAGRQSLARVSLETGAAPEFAPARALYAVAGFAPCAPFGSYAPDPLSVFMTRLI